MTKGQGLHKPRTRFEAKAEKREAGDSYVTDLYHFAARERSRLQHGTFPGAGYRVATWLEVYAGEPDMLSSRMCMCSNHPTSPGGDALLSSLRERAL